MCMYVYVYIYTFMCVYIYVYVSIYICKCICIYICICIYFVQNTHSKKSPLYFHSQPLIAIQVALAGPTWPVLTGGMSPASRRAGRCGVIQGRNAQPGMPKKPLAVPGANPQFHGFRGSAFTLKCPFLAFAVFLSAFHFERIMSEKGEIRVTFVGKKILLLFSSSS